MSKYFLTLLQKLGLTVFSARVMFFLFSVFFIIWIYMYFTYPVPGKGGIWSFLSSAAIVFIIIIFFAFIGFTKRGMSSLHNGDVQTGSLTLLARLFKSFFISGFIVSVVLVIADLVLFEIVGYDLLEHEQLIWYYYLAVATCIPIVYRWLK